MKWKIQFFGLFKMKKNHTTKRMDWVVMETGFTFIYIYITRLWIKGV
jgi:hypothetical protein